MHREGPDEAPFTFHGAAACFSEEDWKLLHEWQKELYNNVMNEIHQALLSLGPIIATTVTSLRAKEQADLCWMNHGNSEMRHVLGHLPEEGDPYWMDNQYCERSENIDISTGNLLVSEALSEPIVKAEEAYMQKEPRATGRNTDDTDGQLEHGYITNMAPTVSFSNMDEEGPSSAVHKDTKRRRRVNPIEHRYITNMAPTVSFSNMDEEGPSSAVHKDTKRRRRVNPIGVASRNRNRKAALFADSTDKLTTFKDLHGKGKMETVKSTEKRIKSISERRSQINHQQGREKEVQCESHLMSPEHSNFHPKTIKIESPDTVNASGSDLLHASLPKLKANRRKYYKPHPCPICGKLFTSKQDLIRHDRTHSGERPFHCTECKKSFTLRHHLTGHQRTHTDEKPYQCSKCNKTFTSIRNLEKHQKSHTETYKTTHCVVTPVGMSSLACYDRTDSGERPFHCIACKKSFSLRHHLIGHQRTHTGEKPYQCTKCDKTFSLIGNLGKHQKTHTVAYKPTHLGKVIPVRKSSIAWPDRTHSGERPFHCTECKKSFTLKHHLIGHQRTHTGEKPYQCSECNKTFSLIGNLAKHKRTHTRAYKTTYHGEVIPVRKSTWKATKKPP